MNRILLIPTPRPIGICAICVMAMCFIFGLFCKEPVLPLIGAVFVCCIVYCFLSLLFLALFHKKKAASLSVRIVPEKASIGENAAIKLSQKTSFFQMPGTLIRYKLLLATKDKKKIERVFDGSLFEKMSADFQIARRGAYYGIYDELALQDIFGFFYTALKLPQDKNARLLAMPIPAASIPEMHSPANGENRRNETETRKTEELTEQRPYTPGDDPRRINWKLYSHAGELFVRQEEREPPPHSQFVLLIDTDVDASLYSFEKGVAAVDSLCSIALAALLEKKAYGDEVLFGYTGGDDVKSGSPAELSAYPAYTAIGCGLQLPVTATSCGIRDIFIMALARRNEKEISSLHDFVKKYHNTQTIRIMFFYDSEETKNHAEASAILFNRITGVQSFTACFTGG